MTKREAQAAVAMSRNHNGKMPCLSYGVPPALTCFWRDWPDEHKADVLSMDDQICSHCYALRGHYRNLPVRRVQEERLRLLHESPTWISDMVRALWYEKYFRFYDSGDCDSHATASKIIEVARLSPATKFWVSTKMAQMFAYLQTYELSTLPNLCVRQGIQVIDEAPSVVHGLIERMPDEVTFSLVMRDPSNAVYPGAVICPATTIRKSCGDCRACFDRDQKLVIYKLH